MKILLISDTHGSSSELRHTILPKYTAEIQMVIHLGDFIRDLLKLQHLYPDLPMLGIGGTFEFDEIKEQIITVGNGVKRKILLTHGHALGVKSNLNRITHYAMEKNADACFFGHTHEAVITARNGIFLMNPGSVVEPRGTSLAGSFGIVTIANNGDIKGELIYV